MGPSGKPESGLDSYLGGDTPFRERPLTFLHLSDIHFRHRSFSSRQFDLEAQLRIPLLEDIKRKPAGADYDGLLITGDIAFGGKKAEYETAKTFLNKIFSEAAVLPERTYVVPGNHDIDRDMVVPGGALWNSHAALRTPMDKVLRRQTLETQLTRDPVCNPLAPLDSYNEFAQGYDCRSEKGQLAWVQDFPLFLNDGSKLRLHGINSALISDAGDDFAKLYVSPFQTQHLSKEPDVVHMLLCHHPPNWLLDKTEVDATLNSFISVALFGHEHTHRLQKVENTVQLFAGAIHPAAREPDWLPTYHILQVYVKRAGKHRKLVVRIYSRELRVLEHTFVSRNASTGEQFEVREIDLPEWAPPEINRPKNNNIPVSSPAQATMDEKIIQPQRDPSTALRELLVHFHRLSTPVRYRIATDLGLLRDGDDFPPQQQWDLVFQRARIEHLLGKLWSAVAQNSPTFRDRTNPYE